MYSYRDSEHHFVVLERGEKFMASLTQYCIEQKLKGAFLKAIGALEKVELGYYELEQKNYIRKTFSEMDYELISAFGNLTLKTGAPYIHIHASFSGPDFQVFGGHLFEAEVAVTAEVQISPLSVSPVRETHEGIGLDLVCRFLADH